MTVCSVLKSDNLYEVCIKGHSGYDTIGKDIVCSAVSSSFILTINLLEKFNSNMKYESDEFIPMMKVTINNYTDIDEKILDNLIDCLKDVSKQYPKYLKIK